MKKLMFSSIKISLLAVVFFLSGCASQLFQNPMRTSQDIIIENQELILKNPNDANAHYMLGFSYDRLGEYEKAIKAWKEQIRVKPTPNAHTNIASAYRKLGRKEEAISEYRKALQIDPNFYIAQKGLSEIGAKKGSSEIATVPRIPSPPQSGTGSGFFVSKMGHVITNAHVVQNCKKITIGDNANKQVPAELINTDRSNDLALLKLSTLEMASAESKSLIQKLNIVVVPLASKGLLRSNDVRLGEKVLVAGYPFGELFSNTIKVTTGVVSATRGAGDDSGQFQLDAAVQPGNSGGPIYDSGGNIVGVVISQLDKLKMAKAIGSLPENVNFGIKASTVRQFLTSSGLPSKKSERTEEKSTEQLAEIAKNQALMVMCLQTESFEQTAESIAEERKKLEKERERIAALQNLKEEKEKLEEERKRLKEKQRVQTEKDRVSRLEERSQVPGRRAIGLWEIFSSKWNVNVYRRMTMNTKIVAWLNDGQIVPVLQSKPTYGSMVWMEVEYETGKTGWLNINTSSDGRWVKKY